MIYIAIAIVVAAFMPRCKRARRGDRVHVVMLIVRERYTAALAREIGRRTIGASK
jgi:hypothetical protein